MLLLQKIARKLLSFVQFSLVFLFILFEEIIWEEIALPICQYIQSFRILQTLQSKINKLNRYIILVLFTLMLLGVEISGLFAGILFVQGKFWSGVMLYASKIPIAAFTFWLFRISKEKLLSFGWFAWAYGQLMRGIAWIKAREMYQSSIKIVHATKQKIKVISRAIQIKYFAEESKFMITIKRLYRYIKHLRNRKST